jgi:hypothetical protein
MILQMRKYGWEREKVGEERSNMLRHDRAQNIHHDAIPSVQSVVIPGITLASVKAHNNDESWE